MTVIAESIFKEAKRLNPIDRAELIEKLFRSFDKSADASVEANWKKEVEERVSAYESGKIPEDTAENVFNRLSGE